MEGDAGRRRRQRLADWRVDAAGDAGVAGAGLERMLDVVPAHLMRGSGSRVHRRCRRPGRCASNRPEPDRCAARPDRAARRSARHRNTLRYTGTEKMPRKRSSPSRCACTVSAVGRTVRVRISLLVISPPCGCDSAQRCSKGTTSSGPSSRWVPPHFAEPRRPPSCAADMRSRHQVCDPVDRDEEEEHQRGDRERPRQRRLGQPLPHAHIARPKHRHTPSLLRRRIAAACAVRMRTEWNGDDGIVAESCKPGRWPL